MADQWRESNNDEELRSWDRFAHARTVIDHEHRLIHEGMQFHANHNVASLANGATFDLLIAAPAGVFPHIAPVSYTVGNDDVDIDAYYGVTTSDDGTAIPMFNRSLPSSKTPGAVWTHTPTVTDIGTLFHERWIPPAGGLPFIPAGATSRVFNEEWVQPHNSKILVRLTNNSGGAIRVLAEILWYELSYEV